MSISIPKQDLTNENIERMEKSLMISKESNKKNQRNKNYYFEPPKIPFFRGEGKNLMIPFYWGRSYFGKKYIPSYPKIEFEFQGNLREEQKELEKESLEHIRENDSSLIAVYPGGGKTITSLSILSKLERCTLIIVNKIVLVEQWKDSIRRFLGIEPFLIGGKKCKIKK